MKTEVNAIMLFVAELTGSFKPGSGTKEDKIKCGQDDYICNNLHELDLTNEQDRKDLHENVWLERFYEELDDYFEIEGIRSLRALSIAAEAYRKETYKWTLPLELDASASLLQYMGVLLNDRRLMEMTNVIGDTLQDPWKLDGMPRAMLKEAATPMLYGSSMLCSDLWNKAGMKHGPKDIELYSNEMSSGPFGLVNMFKEFLIHQCSPKSSMTVKIGTDSFGINCNRFRNVGEKTKAYKIWDSTTETYNLVLHTDTKKVPDLEQFRRFFVTLLIHNLDSQVMNNVMAKAMKKYGWAIPIHDAAVVSPAAAHDVRVWYAEELEYIHANRKTILAEYFKSIGITAAAKEQWEAIKDKVVQFEGDFKCSSMALK
jgi:hypothetical protein